MLPWRESQPLRGNVYRTCSCAVSGVGILMQAANVERPARIVAVDKRSFLFGSSVRASHAKKIAAGRATPVSGCFL
jgi:hypothetical protein